MLSLNTSLNNQECSSVACAQP